MNTTITIKTNKTLRDQAKMVAEKLGIPLTTIINAYLGEFVRERSFAISLEPEPTKKKLNLWRNISKNLDSNKNTKTWNDIETLISHLKLE